MTSVRRYRRHLGAWPPTCWTKRDQIAASLRIPTARFQITHSEDDPSNVVKLFAADAQTGGAVPAAVGTAARTDGSAVPGPVGCTGASPSLSRPSGGRTLGCSAH